MQAIEENNLPPHWSWVKLGNICEIVMGQSPPSTTYNTDQIGLPFFQGKAEFSELYPEVRKWCSKPKKLAEPLDILVSVRAPVGSTNIVNQKCCIGRGLAALRYPDCNKYIFYYFRLVENKLDELGTGSTFKAISSKTLNNFEIPLPPLHEQKQIVEKIEELFSGLDSGVASLKKAKEQLRIYRQSVLAHAFSGKLTEEVKGETKNGELPEGWKWVKLGELSELITKGASPRWQGFEYVSDQTQTLFVTSENVRDNYLDISKPKYLEDSFNEKQKRSILKKGDVLFNLVGASIGRATVFNIDIKSNINQAVAVIRLKDKLKNNYLSYYLNSESAKKYYMNEVVDFARANLSLTDTSNIPIPYCPLAQQTQIVEEIESRFAGSEALEKAIDESLTKAETLRQSILKKAFEGKLV